MPDDLKKKIAMELAKAIAYNEITAKQLEGFMETPKEKEHGDIALPCFKLAGALKKAPKEIAAELKDKVSVGNEIEKIEVAGAYLNFYENKTKLGAVVLKNILKKKDKYGLGNARKGKKIIVEYSQPNTNKPMHLGHLRNNFLGHAVAELFKAQGAKAIKVNLINDRGIHICKSMLAYMKWGKGINPKKAKIKGDHFVGKYYVMFAQKAKTNPELETEAQQLLQKWESGDKKLRALWKKMNKWVIDGFNQTYKDFGISFNTIYLESSLFERGKKIIADGMKKGIFIEKDKAIIADLEKFNLPNKVLLRSDGTSLYMTQDLALGEKKFKDFKFDESIYVVGSEHNLYFKQLFKAFELLGFKWAGKCRHLNYGLVYLPEGKLKSREGKVVDADDLLVEMKKLAEKELKKRYKLSKKELENKSLVIALSALKFFMLKIDAAKDMHFNPKESISFEGETGPYIQYTYARAKSILRKAKTKPKNFKTELLKEKMEKELIGLLTEYSKVLENSMNSLSLHSLARYLIDLSSAFNSFYHELPVNTAEKNLKNARLALVQATAQTLKNGLNLMGISVLEQM